MQEMLAAGSGGGSGSGGASGVIDSLVANTEYEIDTGLSQVKTFMAMGNDYSRYGTMTCYNADFSTTDVAQVGGNAPASSATIPSSNVTYTIGFLSVNGGKVTIKSPSNIGFMGGKIYWSATE